MSQAAQAYPFPTLAEFGESAPAPLEKTISEADAAALKEAIDRGFADGLTHGRAQAAQEAQAELAAAHAEGFAKGHSEGRAEMHQAAAALTGGLEEFTTECDGMRRQCESFCVEIALAIAKRLVGDPAMRAKFVSRAVTDALKVLAPAPPSAIFLNPADHKLVKSALSGRALKIDETLPPGRARVEAGRLLVEADIEQAFERIESALVDVKTRRGCAKPARKRKK
jgi:flagellar biosynthesis/type III secretory pathway protein FliH